MSAIWGQILYTKENTTSMKEYYKKHCKIDRCEEYKSDPIVFGCGIQYITRESVQEPLPICEPESGFFFTSDCLLDNRAELLETLSLLKERKKKTYADGEIMYNAYKKWGVDCLNHFRGLFTMAIYDANKQELILSTDQTASRCVYYYKHDNGVTFSTLLRPILLAHPDLKHSELFMKDFLLAPGLRPNVTSIDTPYENVYKLNPGTYLTITKEGVKETVYWTPSTNHYENRCHRAKQYGAKYLNLLTQAVKDSLRCNGNIGIAQSSGLDSLSVGTLAATLLATRKKSLYAYTYVPCSKETVFENKHYVMNEQNDIRAVAAKYPNMKLHFLDNQKKDCYREIPKILKVLEIPYKSFPNSPSLYELYQHAQKDGCKIMLSGQYGNATISYGNIENILYDLYIHKRFLTMLCYLNHYCKIVKESRKKAFHYCIKAFKEAKQEYQKELSITPHVDNTFLNSLILNNYPYAERVIKGENTDQWLLPVPQNIYQTNIFMKSALAYIGEVETKMGLYHGLLLRDPTRDIRILEFCYLLPYRYFCYNGTPRWLVRENMKSYIPQDILHNWLRYGVQNADWLHRLYLSKDTLLKDIEQVLLNVSNDDSFVSWIDQASLKAFLQEAKEEKTWKNHEQWINVLSICMLKRYLLIE